MHQLEVILTGSENTTLFQGVGPLPTWLPWKAHLSVLYMGSQGCYMMHFHYSHDL